ncbi:N-6 DNA methylase [Planktothrix agardhii]|uniref:N-6 DNA methylase n=1 Tax=Planktothrix agardhii TaxID=1160 RepID=UPI0028B0D433|nr:N-6 DNA methylase [Planktothrix agardhii]
MINQDNFKSLLISLGFEQNKNVLSKYFPHTEGILKVDFNKKELLYPEDQGLTVNERQTCNFSQNENFVVFECVHRLLAKGYKPEHLELEPKWKVGHGASGGRADILVKNQQDKPMLIIECKTAGKEFEKAWKDTQTDGGQLFSYAQQIQETEFLCLYTSYLLDNNCIFEHYVISHKDNPKILADDIKLLSFEKAKDVRGRFKVWQETYQLEATTKGIFEDNIPAYQIGKDKYTIDDLAPINAKDKEGKYLVFRTILRKHNVSGRENVFDILVNLFLCKIVDETQHPQELKFYWKGIAYDNYYDFIDRLQGLYKYGMERYLGEEITYISNEQIEGAFWSVNRDAIKTMIKDYFRQLKFFTNNDFAFINVYNKELFDKNMKVLLEIVQMWQDLRLKNQEQNQFLGDMFEFFLDNGIKQSEGQFFTPIPITRFICMALPLESVIREKSELPMVLDFACGAGHFLTELAIQTKPFIQKYRQIEPSTFFKNIYGIEKESRLSKVAKVSAFMYGQEGINILPHDALDNIPEIKLESFDILVANPPFAVEDFLDTLSEEQRPKYELFKTISDLGNKNIQCFFIERAKQLLAPNGVAGIIVPSSVLSNSDNTHIATREILLKYFDIVSIVELGSNTFSKTRTNTVVLFLRRKSQRPEPAEQYDNRVLDFFENWQDELESGGGMYRDIDSVKKYCEHIEVDFEDYQSLLLGVPSEQLLEYDLFKEYKNEFDKSTDIVNLKKRKSFKDCSLQEQDAELNKRFLEYLQRIEKDKLYYFILAFNNPQKVLIVKSPADNKEQKQFLGYEWSGDKHNPGLKYISGSHITPLFDPDNCYNPEKINYWIQQNFNGDSEDAELPNLEYITYANLVDLLDFSRKDFNKTFSLTPKKDINIEEQWSNKYPLRKLAEVTFINPSKTEIKDLDENILVSFVEMASVSDQGFIANKVDKPLKDLKKGSYTYFFENDIIIAKITPCMENGKCALARGLTNSLGMGSSEFHVIRAKEKDVLIDFIFALLNRDIIRKYAEQNMTGASGHRRVPESFYENIKIPLPSLEVQQQIVDECEAIEQSVIKAKEVIEQARKEIEDKVRSIFNKGYSLQKLSNLVEIIGGGTPNTRVPEYWNGDIPWLSVADFSKGERFVSKSEKTITELGLKNSSTKFLQAEDLIISARGTVGALAQLAIPMTFNQSCYGLRGLDTVDNGYLYFVLSSEIKQFKDNAYGSKFDSITTKTFDSIKIPVPPLKI